MGRWSASSNGGFAAERTLAITEAVPAPAGASCTGATRPLVEQPTLAPRADHRPRSVLPIGPSGHGPGVCARSEGARSGASGHRDRSLRGPRNAVGEDVLLHALGAFRGARTSGNGGQARRGTRRARAGRATQSPRALGGASPWPSRRDRPLRAPAAALAAELGDAPAHQLDRVDRVLQVLGDAHRPARPCPRSR